MNFSWQGQSCGSTSRLIAHQSVHDELVERLGARLEEMVSGRPSEESTDTGAIVSQPQLEKVLDYIRIGQEQGARLVAGGRRAEGAGLETGRFVRPTLFADVEPDSRLAQEEIFGPVLAAMPFRDYDEAIRIANDVQYGLTASVFTRDLETAHRFAEDVEAGYVWVNDVSRHTPGTPFGGFKNSGLGREEDIEELESYTQTKNVHIRFAQD
jgi:betaine-aldehyde dehydrogenase